MSAKLRVIWIDDERDPKKWMRYVPEEFLDLYHHSGRQVETVCIRNYREWMDWVIHTWNSEDDNEYINCFCLDHDLGSFIDGKEKTGRDVALDIIDELIRSGRKMPYYECHSSNPAGRENIISIFESYKKVFMS